MKILGDYNFNIIGLSEVNIHLPLANLAIYLEETISGHWEARNSVMACNLEDDATKVWQLGACLKISTERTTHRVISTGSDTSGQGRWVWTCNWGKHNLTLREITAYIPCTKKQYQSPNQLLSTPTLPIHNKGR